MKQPWEYATVEWIWSESKLRCTRPGTPEWGGQGSYVELVNLLSGLGREGWEVCACSGAGNWLFWTLKRPLT